MDQSEDREEGVPPSTTTVSGEHENQTRDQRMDNKLSNMTDCNGLYWNQYPYYRPYITSSYMNLTQSDCREKQSKDETTETHNKRTDDEFTAFEESVIQESIKGMENKLSSMADLMKAREDVMMAHIKLMENKLSSMADCNGLYWNQYPYYRPYITYYPLVSRVSAGTRPDRPLKTGSEPEPYVKPAEHHQSKILPIRGQQEGPDSDGSDYELELIDGGQLSSIDLPDHIAPRSESESEPSCESIKSVWSSNRPIDFKDSQPSVSQRSSYMNLTQSDCREEPPPYETTGMRKKRMENKLSNMTDCNGLYWNQYPYYRPDITYYPPVGPVSDGIRPERPLASGSEPEPKVNPAEHHQSKILPSSYMNLTQSDCREKQSKYETTKTHNKRTDDELYKTTDYNELYQKPYPYYRPEITTENKLSNMADWMKQREDVLMAQNKFMMDKLCIMTVCMKEREDVLMAHMKQMENKLDLMKEREDALMAHMKQMDNKLSNMADLMKQREDVLMAQNKLKRLQDEGSDSAEPEPREEPSSHPDSGRTSCEFFSTDPSISCLIGFKGSRPSALKRKRLEDEGSDSTESEHEPRDEPSSHSDSDGKSSCVSFKSDDSMNRPIDFKGSQPSALNRKRL